MANREHLARLQQGLEAWNTWRKKYPKIQPNLRRTDFTGGETIGELSPYTLFFNETALYGADLTETDLREAYFIGMALHDVGFAGADLTEANFYGAHCLKTDFNGADLTGANFGRADFHDVNLTGANFHRAYFGWTILSDVDLSTARGLETIRHGGPSTIGIDTLYRSKGNIPEIFLQGAGVPEEIITYAKSLVGRPFEYYSCFISYASKDTALAERLYADLRAAGVRCWFAPEDMKIGDEFRSRIDESIHIHDKLLLILSKHSLASSWVQKEVETAFEKEAKENRLVLFPIRTDQAVMESRTGWAADIHRTRHIGDFRRWKHHDTYQQGLDRLLRDLKPNTTLL